MIRRDVRLADGTPGWALISQIEHARVSALLAWQCRGRFGPVHSSLIRDEVLVAIAAHDDGWAEWEQAPQLDARTCAGRCRSWSCLSAMRRRSGRSRSPSLKRSARWPHDSRHGSYELLEHSEHARFDPVNPIVGWPKLASQKHSSPVQAIRSAARDPVVADEMLQWLWAFDEASLWFCCRCPVGGESRPDGGVPYVAGRTRRRT